MLVKQLCKYIGYGFLGIVFSGCMARQDVPTNASPTLITSENISVLHKQFAQLQKQGVQVILVGDELTFILSSDQFFLPDTPIINRRLYPVLNEIAYILDSVDKVSVKIVGYTDNQGWPLRSLALSRQQALTISTYLLNRGVDARLLYPVGYGQASPIASNATAQGQATNRRIEISLRLLSHGEEV